MKECDFLIIGAGIGGASAAYGLAKHGSVIIVEQENQPGYHTTGRSAAFYAETYGNDDVGRLTSASKSFFHHPPVDFCDGPLVSGRGALYIARLDQLAACDEIYRRKSRRLSGLSRLESREARILAPYIRHDYLAGAVYEPDCEDIDVYKLHQGFLRGAQQLGAELITNKQVESIYRDNKFWIASTKDGDFRAKVMINAAGAWGDTIAKLAGLKPLGLIPKRRTIVVGSLRDGQMDNDWPLVLDINDQFYFKPENGQILATPGDETPMPPCDVQPDELDVAVTVDRIEKASTLKIDRITNKWAGLRTFARDRSPIIGMDANHDGFFWAVGQGGFGIQTAPAISDLIRSLLVENKVPEYLQTFGVKTNMFAPNRPKLLC